MASSPIQIGPPTRLSRGGGTVVINSSGAITLTPNSGQSVLVAGVLTAGTGPTTLTDAAGKVLSAALNTVAIAQGGTGAVTAAAARTAFGVGTGDSPTFAGATLSGPLDVVTATVTAYGVSVVGSGFSSLDPTIFSPSTWAPSVRVGRDLNLVGTGTNGSANQFAVVVQTQTAATSSGASYEKGGIITIARSSDPSAGTSITRDVVGLDTRGYVAAGNTVARVWGGITQSYIEATGDGYTVAWEVEATNNAAADQTAMNTTTTKVGIHVVTDGSQNSTCAIVINAAGSARWHKGLYSHDGVISSTGNFIQYVSSVYGNDLFTVDHAGVVTAAGPAFNSAASPDSLSWGQGLARVGRLHTAAGTGTGGSANEFGIVVQGYTNSTTGSQVAYEKAAIYGVAQTVDPSYNSVRFLTVTAGGNTYTTPPTLTIAAPGGTSASAGAGVTATAVAYLGVNTAAVSAGGTGYVVGDVIFLSGGTGRAAAFLTVATLSGSAVATVTVSSAGEYSAVPANPAATTALSGVGTGCTLTLNWKVVTAQITKNGWGYTTTAPAVTVGSGAATVTATATTFDVTRDSVGVHGSGVIGTLNTSGRAWALYGIGYVEAGGDGYVSCAEIELRNGATTDQPLVNTATSKVGLHIVASGGAWGTQNGTCALYLNGAGGSLWHKALYMEPNDLSADGGGAFIELLAKFKVTKDGVTRAAAHCGQSFKQWGANLYNAGSTTSPSTTLFAAWGYGTTFSATATTLSVSSTSAGQYGGLATSTTSGNQAKLEAANFTQTQRQFSPVWAARVRTDAAAITSSRYLLGLFSASPNADAPATHYAAFRYSTAADGTAFWRTMTNNAGTATVTTTTAAIAADTDYDLMIDCTDSANVRFYVNGTLAATHTLTLPTSTQDLGVHLSVATLTTAARTLRVGQFNVAQR